MFTTDEWKQTPAVCNRGHFFGELSIPEKKKHEAIAVATTNTYILLRGREDFEKLEKKDPAAAFMIMKKIVLVMCKNLRRMNDRFMNTLILREVALMGIYGMAAILMWTLT